MHEPLLKAKQQPSVLLVGCSGLVPDQASLLLVFAPELDRKEELTPDELPRNEVTDED